MKRQKTISYFAYTVLLIVAVNLIGSVLYKRFDLTDDKRYTLSEAALQTVDTVRSPILVEVLLDGRLPGGFSRLKEETRQLLREFAVHNRQVKFEFFNPEEFEAPPEEIGNQLAQMGITPADVTVREKGRATVERIYPWAIVSYGGNFEVVPLLKGRFDATKEEQITNSIQNLEYAFADAFHKLLAQKSKKIAILRGNGQLDEKYLLDFGATLREYYFLAPFTLERAADEPEKTLKDLLEYDLVLSAKPTEAFSDTEKYILDQYSMQGGKSLWLIDQVAVEMDSLRRTGSAFALGRDLNLTDFFFRYGLRINPILVNDMYAAPLTLATGQDSESGYQQALWFYSPLSLGVEDHPITTNIDPVKFDFAGAIDTLESPARKTVLLSSSRFTRLRSVPLEVSLGEVDAFRKMANAVQSGTATPNMFSGPVPLAVLLEGEFTSVFKNRIRPFRIKGHIDEGIPAKMVVVSDGDVIRNELDHDGRPIELGFDRGLFTRYGNKDFLLNTVNYLLDDTGLINIRSKDVAVAFLDPVAVDDHRAKWQVMNLVLPLLLLFLFGLGFHLVRKRVNR